MCASVFLCVGVCLCVGVGVYCSVSERERGKRRVKRNPRSRRKDRVSDETGVEKRREVKD